jgi:hypothetical protein
LVLKETVTPECFPHVADPSAGKIDFTVEYIHSSIMEQYLLCVIILWVCLHSSFGARRPMMHGNLDETSKKIQNKIAEYEELKIPVRRRNLVVYYLGNVDQSLDSMDVPTNNVKLFVSSILNHFDNAPETAFYLFNVANGKENPLKYFLPKNLPYVGIIDWIHVSDEVELQIKCLQLLGPQILESFSSVIFLGHEVRGPLLYRNNGAWIKEYRNILDNNNVGMVGPTLRCDSGSKGLLANYMFMARPSLLRNVLADSSLARGMFGNSDAALQFNYNISSMLYVKRYKQPYFDGRCPLAIGTKVRIWGVIDFFTGSDGVDSCICSLCGISSYLFYFCCYFSLSLSLSLWFRTI